VGWSATRRSVDGGDFIGAVDGVDLDEFAVVGERVLDRRLASSSRHLVLKATKLAKVCSHG
jgi:hypothetical protein